MVGCMCCGVSVSGMGGPGGYVICQDCLDKMRNGEMAEAVHSLNLSRDKIQEVEK